MKVGVGFSAARTSSLMCTAFEGWHACSLLGSSAGVDVHISASTFITSNCHPIVDFDLLHFNWDHEVFDVKM